MYLKIFKEIFLLKLLYRKKFKLILSYTMYLYAEFFVSGEILNTPVVQK